MKTPKIDIVVTRHPSLVAYLRELGLVAEDTPVIEHASAEDVRDRHVLGILPHHLSSHARTITEIPMRTTLADREAMQRGDLTLARLREIAGEPVTYTVEKGWSPTKYWAVTTEPHPNGRDVFVAGGDRTAGGTYYLRPLDLKYDIHFHTDDCGHYRDGGSYVIQGTARINAAAWSEGRVSLTTDKTAVEHAEYVKRCEDAGVEPLPWREAIDVPVAVIAAVEWHDLVPHFSAGSTFGLGKPVAIMQHEPLVLFPNGSRMRIRWTWINGDERGKGIEFVPVPDGDDDGMRKFDTDSGPRFGRCRNEADLIAIAERELTRRFTR